MKRSEASVMKESSSHGSEQSSQSFMFVSKAPTPTLLNNTLLKIASINNCYCRDTVDRRIHLGRVQLAGPNQSDGSVTNQHGDGRSDSPRAAGTTHLRLSTCVGLDLLLDTHQKISLEIIRTSVLTVLPGLSGRLFPDVGPPTRLRRRVTTWYSVKTAVYIQGESVSMTAGSSDMTPRTKETRGSGQLGADGSLSVVRFKLERVFNSILPWERYSVAIANKNEYFASQEAIVTAIHVRSSLVSSLSWPMRALLGTLIVFPPPSSTGLPVGTGPLKGEFTVLLARVGQGKGSVKGDGGMWNGVGGAAWSS
ncbi:hypothetical protein Bbelb_322080 [Branchiostoma belcheri]|nr:hypothetical protein Bbelb_322080 [Branchiostoma belcheri]